MGNPIKILHFWTTDADAERLVRELASSGCEFEAKLVRTLPEFVRALVSKKVDLVIADMKSDASSGEELTIFEIVEELSPGTPLISLLDSQESSQPEDKKHAHSLGRRELDRLKEVIRNVLPCEVP